jgi:hypothetical protein
LTLGISLGVGLATAGLGAAAVGATVGISPTLDLAIKTAGLGSGLYGVGSSIESGSIAGAVVGGALLLLSVYGLASEAPQGADRASGADKEPPDSFGVDAEVSPEEYFANIPDPSEVLAADLSLSTGGIDSLGGQIPGALDRGLSKSSEQHAGLMRGVARLREAIKNIQVDGPSGTRIIQLRYQRLPVVRLDYGPYPGTHGQPRLHGHLPRMFPDKHIPLDPLRFTDPGGLLKR